MSPMSAERALRSFLIASAVVLSTGCASQSAYNPLTGDSIGGKPLLVITSPRHPRTFDVSGNDKLSQELRWNSETQTLSAFVTYSLVSGGGDEEIDPANYRVLELPFPNIKLDRDNNLFVLDSRDRKVMIGRLEDGIFGRKVVLNENVRLSAHRHDRELSGKLVVSAN